MKKAMIFLIITLLLIAVYVVSFSGLFDIRSIRFNQEYISEEEVLDKIGVEMGDNLFLLSPRDIRNNLAGDSRFEAISMRKNYPDELVLHISYRKPVARLLMGTQSVYVDEDAVIVYIGNEIYDAVTIEGMSIEGAEVGRTIEAGEGSRFRRALDLADLVGQSDLGMESIYFDNEELTLTITKGFTAHFGKEGDLERAFSVLVAVYQDVIKDGTSQGKIDLRNPERPIFIPVLP